MSPLSVYRWTGTKSQCIHGTGADYTPGTSAYDFSDAEPPWAYQGTTQPLRELEFMSNYPTTWAAPAPIVNIQTGAATFRDNVLNTIASNGRCIIRLGVGIYHLTSFEPAAGDEMYAFGLWHTNMAGFIGQGPDKTIIQMDANSLNATQLAGISAMTKASGQVLQISFMRIDGEATSPAVLAGLTFQAADQQTVNFASDNLIANGQPAPHGGVFFYKRGVSPSAYGYVSHVRLVGAARAATSLPPFEAGNLSSQYGTMRVHHVESDGRRAAALNPARPRRCGVFMGNNDYGSLLSNVWLHHSNVSRYAVNDQNSNTSGPYTVEFSKVEQITNTQNTDPALNGGSSLGGYTNATLMGWESVNGVVTIHDCILTQDNSLSAGQSPMHFQLTSVGARNPQGGRLYAYNNTYNHNGFPQLDGYACFRVDDVTFWYTDGLANTLDVRETQASAKKTPWTYTGSAPPSAGVIAAAGISPSTHYIVSVV